MIPKKQIEAAKRADLPQFLKAMGVELIRNGKGYHLREHDSLKLFQQEGIWLYKWYSRDGEVGDGIQYLRCHCGMSFPEAVTALSGTIYQNSTPKHHGYRYFHRLNSQNKIEQYKTEKWQRASKKLILAAQSHLFGPNGKERLSYLIHDRGLHKDTVRKHQLGWLPAKANMHSKILIPCYDSLGNLIRIRFRIDNPDKRQQRYRISSGSNPNSPFPLGISSSKPVMILESELDAILVAQEAPTHVGVLGLGSTATKLSPAMLRYLIDNIAIVLISMDNDTSGRLKANDLLDQLSNAIDWPVSKKHGKDPGEAWKKINLKKWVVAGLRNHPTLNR